jgi:NADH-quinone oxidoreductase E subunit
VTRLDRAIAQAAAAYPDRHSAVLEALRLAQEEHDGWLPSDALVEVADALDVTPAYTRAIASFYDMFHLEPVGRHLVEVCTNLSCALVGAQRVVEAFESELGVLPGETTEDGAVTFRTVECLGGCGYATVVAVDHRYRQFVKPDDVPGIVAELGAGGGADAGG